MRGTQCSPTRGIVAFSTIYPGWYPGRTPHIHFTAILADRRTSVTGQMFFPDASAGNLRDGGALQFTAASEATYNDRDGIARRAGRPALAELTRQGAALQAALVISIAG